MKTGRNNNLGVSLVELMVVVSILAVLSAGMVTGMGMMSGKKAKECATQINSAIGKTKLETLSKSVGADSLDNMDTYLEVYKAEDGTIHARICVKGTEEDTKVGERGLKVQYMNAGDETVHELVNAQDSFKIGFDRSTGAFMKNGTVYVENILISYGQKVYEIHITQETGKYQLTE